LATTEEGLSRRERRVRARLLALLGERFRRAVEAAGPDRDGLDEATQKVALRREDPYSAAARLFQKIAREPVGE
jgi:hypothetical protein